jgi:hypothetical protein
VARGKGVHEHGDLGTVVQELGRGFGEVTHPVSRASVHRTSGGHRVHGARAWQADQVRGQCQVPRFLLPQDGGDNPVVLLYRPLLRDSHRGAGDLLCRAQEMAVVAVEQTVVDGQASALDLSGGGAGDGHAFGVTRQYR